MRREFHIMKEIESLNISPVIYLFLREGIESLLILEYIGPALDEIELQMVPNVEKYLIMCDMIDILFILQDNGIVHRDLKPDNFCIDANSGKVKIIDFGMAKQISVNGKFIVQDTMREYMACGTLDYCSDRSLNYHEPSYRDEWESIVLVFAFVLLEEFPFMNLKSGQELEMIEYRRLGMKNYIKGMAYKDMYWELIDYFRNLEFNEKPQKQEILRKLTFPREKSKKPRARLQNRANHYKNVILDGLVMTDQVDWKVGQPKNPSLNSNEVEVEYKRRTMTSKVKHAVRHLT